MTELLDFFGQGTYSPDYQAPQPDARLWSVGHTSRIGGSKKESRAWAAESRASAVTPSRSPSLKRPRKPQPGAFLFSVPGVDLIFPLAFLALLVPMIRTRIELVIAVFSGLLALALHQGLPGGLAVLVTGIPAACSVPI